MLRCSSRVRVRTRRRRHRPSGAPPAPSSGPPTLPRPCPTQRTTPHDPYDQLRRPWPPCSTTTAQPGSCVQLGLSAGCPFGRLLRPRDALQASPYRFPPGTLILLLFSNISRRRDMLNGASTWASADPRTPGSLGREESPSAEGVGRGGVALVPRAPKRQRAPHIIPQYPARIARILA